MEKQRVPAREDPVSVENIRQKRDASVSEMNALLAEMWAAGPKMYEFSEQTVLPRARELLADPELQDDKAFGLFMVHSLGDFLSNLSERLKDDPEIVDVAVRRNCESFRFASERLRDDEEFILGLWKEINHSVSPEKGMVIRNLSPRLARDVDFARKMLAIGGSASDFPKETQQALKHPA